MRILTAALLLTMGISASSQVYKDTNASAHDRAVSIVSQMTLEEKVSLMQHSSPAIERLGIEQYNWWNEALHGVARAGLATVFPQPIGLAATFDDRLIYDIFTTVSDEARAKHHAAKSSGPLKIYQGLTFWTPNINIFRDPRWGRGHETYGEDPYLTSVMGTSVVRGLQGDSYEGGLYQGPNAPRHYKLNACAKHFAVHSGPEWSRHTFNAVDISNRDLYETYLPAFKALVQDAGVREVMCAYNRYENEPCCSNNKLLQRILRNQWGYTGIVLSDCWALNDLYTPGHHYTEPDAAHASAKAVRTGTDLECGETYGNLADAVHQGLIAEEQIDQSLIRLMEARYQLGEMDDDSMVEWASIPMSIVDCDEHKALARRAALESIVLLKNDGTLPLQRSAKIALLGPNANDSVMQLGNYNGFPSSTSTLLTALTNGRSDHEIKYIPGIGHAGSLNNESFLKYTTTDNGIGYEAMFWNELTSLDDIPSSQPDATMHFGSALNLTTAGATVWAPGINLGGFTAIFRTTLIPERTEQIVFSVQTMGYTVLTINGEEIFKGGNMKNDNAYPITVEAGKTYDIMLMFKATEGECASLSFDFGVSIPLDIDGIIEQVRDCDVVIYAGGLSPMLEGEEMPVAIPGFRGGDRETIELPEVQTQILEALNRAGKTIVYVNYSGSAVAIGHESDLSNAVLQAWYPGQDGGEAVADVLYGVYNPSGHLPLTFYKSTDDLPDFEDYNMEGHTYRYFRGEPLYPFGYGLSYTTFDIGEAAISENGNSTVLTIPVTNTGDRRGSQVLQVYLSKPGEANGPIRQLRAFTKVELEPGESRNVDIELTDRQFEWFDEDSQTVRVLSGDFDIQYGTSSAPKDLHTLRFHYTAPTQ